MKEKKNTKPSRDASGRFIRTKADARRKPARAPQKDGKGGLKPVFVLDRIGIVPKFSPCGQPGSGADERVRALEDENNRLRGRVRGLLDLAYASGGVTFRWLFTDLLKRHQKALDCAKAFRDEADRAVEERRKGRMAAFVKGIASGIALASAAFAVAVLLVRAANGG